VLNYVREEDLLNRMEPEVLPILNYFTHSTHSLHFLILLILVVQAGEEHPAGWVYLCGRDTLSKAGVTDRHFNELDIDGDGQLSEQELEAIKLKDAELSAAIEEILTRGSAEQFLAGLSATVQQSVEKARVDDYDLDGDGQLSETELKIMKQAKQKALEDAALMDPEGKGMIAREAFKAAGYSDADFDLFDLDGDGVLDRAELEAMAAQKFKLPLVFKDMEKSIGKLKARNDFRDKFEATGDAIQEVVGTLEAAGCGEDAAAIAQLQAKLSAQDVSSADMQISGEDAAKMCKKLEDKGKWMEAAQVKNLGLQLDLTAQSKLQGEQLCKQLEGSEIGQAAIELGSALAESLHVAGHDKYGEMVNVAVNRARSAINANALQTGQIHTPDTPRMNSNNVNDASVEARAVADELSAAAEDAEKAGNDGNELREGAAVMQQIAGDF